MKRVIISLLCTAGLVTGSDKFAVLIGISGYPQFPTEKRLKYADRDASEFAEFLRTPSAGAFPESNIRLVTNEHATRAGIKQAMAWLSARSTADDVVYVYFAGHGVTDSFGRAYFMPWDGSPFQPEIAGIGADEFLGDFRRRISAKQLIFFVDACHAGAALTSAGLTDRDASNTTAALLESWNRELATRNELTMAFLSASANQRSYEDQAVAHGLFTWYLLEGLRGKADRNQDGKITASELRRFIVDGVEDQTNSKQSPVTSPGFDPLMVMAIHRPEPEGISDRLETIERQSIGLGGHAVEPRRDGAIVSPSEDSNSARSPSLARQRPSERLGDSSSKTVFLLGVSGFNPIPYERSGLLRTPVLALGRAGITVTAEAGSLRMTFEKEGGETVSIGKISCKGLAISSAGARVFDPALARIPDTLAVTISSSSGSITYFSNKNSLQMDGGTAEIKRKLEQACKML